MRWNRNVTKYRKSTGTEIRYEETKKPSYEEVQMNSFSGKGKVGLFAIFAILLMPLLGVGTASAFEVGEKVDVLVPDLRVFADPAEAQQFTCRAITDHAVWLVQDISILDIKGAPDTSMTPKVVWGSDPDLNMVDPTSFAAITAAFESTVWGTVTALCGTPVDIDGNGKIVIACAAIPTKYSPSTTTTAARNTMYYVDPTYFEIDGTAMEVFYLNIHPLTTNEAYYPALEEMRMWNTANGLAYLAMCTNDPLEEAWLLRGISEVAQYECFGYTQSVEGTGNHGIYEMLNEFRKAAALSLISPISGTGKWDYAASRGQGFLFFMYFAQRLGSDFVPAVAQDTENVGMASVAYAIDPAYDPETAQNDLVFPLYYDWLICNLHNDFRSDYMGGIYMYDFLEGTTWEDWAHAGSGASAVFSLNFSSYPIPGKATDTGIDGPIWAAQYVKFSGIDQNWTTYFNGQYSDGRGSRSAVNSRWEGNLILCDDTAGEFTSIEALEFDDLFNSTFTLSGTNAYLIVTNNNSGGAGGMKLYISNDGVPPVVETAIHQNSVMSQYINTYSALYDVDAGITEGYDWVGPIFQATMGDSTANIQMSAFYGNIWTGIFSAWTSGNFELSFAGYDSTGHEVESVRTVAVGFADSELSLALDYCALYVPSGGAPSGAMITLAETDALGLSVQSSAAISAARGQLTGVIAGPVTIPDVNGTISFVSGTNDASIYRYTEQGWEMLDSWRQNGNTSAAVEQGGIYALGEGIGAFAPELPAQLILGATSPNPFSAQTAISFGLPVEGNVRVNVFDMTGRLVNTLANEEMAAANHTLVWDGTDVHGNVVGAGVYFCRLEAAGQVLTQKMLKVQ